MRSATHSVRPPYNSAEMGGGSDAKAGEGRNDMIESRGAAMPPVFPMQETDGAAAEGNADDLICIPCDEEEQTEMPLCLPSVYQPARSEYMDNLSPIVHSELRASIA